MAVDHRVNSARLRSADLMSLSVADGAGGHDAGEVASAMIRDALAAEGVKDLNLKIWAMPVQRPYNPNARRMAELMQADFAKFGVTVEIVSYEWGEYLTRSKAEDRDGAVLRPARHGAGRGLRRPG